MIPFLSSSKCDSLDLLDLDPHYFEWLQMLDPFISSRALVIVISCSLKIPLSNISSWDQPWLDHDYVPLWLSWCIVLNNYSCIDQAHTSLDPKLYWDIDMSIGIPTSFIFEIIYTYLFECFACKYGPLYSLERKISFRHHTSLLSLVSS